MSQIPSHTHSLSQSANNQREATTIPTATQQYEADDIKLLQHTKTDKYSEYYTYVEATHCTQEREDGETLQRSPNQQGHC